MDSGSCTGRWKASGRDACRLWMAALRAGVPDDILYPALPRGPEMCLVVSSPFTLPASAWVPDCGRFQAEFPADSQR